MTRAKAAKEMHAVIGVAKPSFGMDLTEPKSEMRPTPLAPIKRGAVSSAFVSTLFRLLCGFSSPVSILKRIAEMFLVVFATLPTGSCHPKLGFFLDHPNDQLREVVVYGLRITAEEKFISKHYL
jgi:hypothetical protein